MTFINYKTIEPVNPRVFTDDEKKIVTDAFAIGKSITEIKHENFFPTSLIENSIRHKKITESFIIKLMKKQVIVSEEVSHLDEEGNKVIDSPIVYNSKPTTLTKLKELVSEKFPNCTITDYNVDAIINNATSTGTWTSFSEVF